MQLAENLKKVSPRTVIFLGGPEVSYDAAEMLSRYPYLDLIVRGEGEATFLDLARHWIDGTPALADIPGITWRAPGPSIVENAARPPLNLQDNTRSSVMTTCPALSTGSSTMKPSGAAPISVNIAFPQSKTASVSCRKNGLKKTSTFSCPKR